MATQLTQGDIKQGEATKIVYNTREELTVESGRGRETRKWHPGSMTKGNYGHNEKLIQ